MSEQPPYPPGAPWPQQPGYPAAPPSQYPAPPPEATGKATTALVLGILGIFLCGPFTAIPAIVVGRNAVKEIDASGGRLGGRGLGTAGFVLGIVGVGITVIALAVVVLIFALGATIRHDFQHSCTTSTDSNGYSTVTC